MNNSPDRVMEDIVRLLLEQVLPRLDEDAVRAQVFAAVFMIETLRLRLDWASEPLSTQIRAQDALFNTLKQVAPGVPDLPAGSRVPETIPSGSDLLALRDAGNAVIADLVAGRIAVDASQQDYVDALLEAYVKLELELERPHWAKPMFAQISSGQH